MSQEPSSQSTNSTSRATYFRQLYQTGQTNQQQQVQALTSQSNPSSEPPALNTATQNYNIGLASLGESHNTKLAYDAAIKCFDAYAESTEDVPSLAQITNEMIENDNLKVLLLKFAVYLGSTDIRSQRGGLLTVASKMNYLSKIKESLMKKFPDHPAWSDASTDKTGWWSQLRCRAEKAMKRNDGSDVLQTRPLYRHIKESADWYPVDLRDDNSKYPQDLHGIIATLFEESTSFREYDNTTVDFQVNIGLVHAASFSH